MGARVRAMDLPELEGLAGLLRHDEGMRLAELAGEVPSGYCIVELGAFKGKSACYLGCGSRAGAGVPVFSVDLWGHPTPSDLDREERFEAKGVFAEFQRQVSMAGVDDLVIPRASLTANLGWRWDDTGPGTPVGLLLIDADHSFEGARADYEAWERHIPSGGVLAFHDYNRNVPGVIRCVEEVVKPGGEWIVEAEALVRHLWTARRR